MTNKAKIKKVLVVLSPDLIKPDSPKQSPLMQRAVSLAKNTGCELELFHVCYDSGLEHQLFESDADLKGRRTALTDRDATLLSAMATKLKDQSINASYEVRWDSPRTDAILRKIEQAKPDIVMKQSRQHSFVLGITSNTDWDLMRRSPAHVWLVNDMVEGIDKIMAAIGNKFGAPGNITNDADTDLLRTAGLIGDIFDAAIYPVNAYQIPNPQHLVSGVEGAMAPLATAGEQNGPPRPQIAKQHQGAVKELADYFGIPKDNVYVHEGRPDKVISDVAESIGANMIVMGASSIGRFERLVSSVTVEPVMADTNTDIFIVRERDNDRVPDVVERPIYGVPKYDLEHAITNPEATFDSPHEVANLSEISVELRNRILQAWEYDIRSQMRVENEGGSIGDIDINSLDQIISARAELEPRRQKPVNDQMALHGMSG